ncbi:MAG: AI-2E family transporter [Chloroflexi bacterium]|nr:AI-2E family transporter [Chloroflexota bacterium]
MIRDPWLRALVAVMCAIASIYLVTLLWQVLQQFSDILLLFFLAWLLAFVLEPVVTLLRVHGRLPRSAAIGLTYATLLVVIAVGIVLLVPALADQIGQVVRDLPTYADRIASVSNDLAASSNTWLTDRGSPVLVDARALLDPADLTRRIEALGPPLLNNAVQLATGAATLLLEAVIVLILSFYFMADGPRISHTAIALLPPRAQDDTRYLVFSIHRAFAGFLRGQVIQGLVSGLGTGLAMAALGVEYALLSAVVAGGVILIPFLGPVVAVGLPVAIALFTRSGWDWAVLLVILFAMQQVIFNVLSPRIMSRQVGIHPLLVFFAVLAGARLAGVWGAVFGIPVVAVVVTMVLFYRASQQERLARLQEHLAPMGHERGGADPPDTVGDAVRGADDDLARGVPSPVGAPPRAPVSSSVR